MSVTYNITDITSGLLDERTLHNEILTSDIDLTGFEGIVSEENGDFEIIIGELSVDDQTILDALIANHKVNPDNPYVTIVDNAIDFFQEIMITYAAHNITSGITQAGKTKEVSDYMKNVMHYGQSGSLYEVIHEIDRLLDAGIPASLDPYVSIAICNCLKTKINNYLTS